MVEASRSFVLSLLTLFILCGCEAQYCMFVPQKPDDRTTIGFLELVESQQRQIETLEGEMIELWDIVDELW